MSVEVVTHTLFISRNCASCNAAISTPWGRQLNLYFNGTPRASWGDGKPPQKDVKECIFFFSDFNLSSKCIAERWSMPGSSPTSFRSKTPSFLALFGDISAYLTPSFASTYASSRSCMSAPMYEAVTIGVLLARQIFAIFACMSAGNKL